MAAKALNLPITHVAIENGKSRSVFPIALTSLTGALIFLIPPMYFTHIAADLEITTSALGVTTTVLLLASTLTALVTGPLADRQGIRPLLIAGLVAASGYFIGFSLATTRDFLLLAAVLGGVAHAILPNLSAAAAGSMSLETARRRALGWTSGSAALSVVIVSPLLAVVVTVAGWRAAFALAAVFSLGAGLVIRTLMRVDPSTAGGCGFIEGYLVLLHHRQSRMLYAASFLRAICWFGMLTYLGAFVGDTLNEAPLAISGIFAAGGSTFFAGSLLTPRLMQRMPAITILAATQSAMAVLVAVLFLGSVTYVAALIVVALLGLIGGFSFVALTAMLIEQTPVGRSTTMSLNGVLTSGSAAVGGAMGASLLTIADYELLALFSLPAVISVLILYWPVTWTLRTHVAVAKLGEDSAGESFRKSHISLTIES